jgi:hypothetical protein
VNASGFLSSILCFFHGVGWSSRRRPDLAHRGARPRPDGGDAPLTGQATNQPLADRCRAARLAHAVRAGRGRGRGSVRACAAAAAGCVTGGGRPFLLAAGFACLTPRPGMQNRARSRVTTDHRCQRCTTAQGISVAGARCLRRSRPELPSTSITP